MEWTTSRRMITLERAVVMGILNVTPDSFSDGGKYGDLDAAVVHAEHLIADGADVIDVGGESTRPGSSLVAAESEMSRVIPVIEAIAKRYDVAISIDTTKAVVAAAALDAGAEIINDISGLRWEPAIADVAARSGAGLILMHSRGDFAEMHSRSPVPDIITEVASSLGNSIATAEAHGVTRSRLALDVGIGFGKTFEQNLELLAKLDQIEDQFAEFPLVVGTSRKSFIGRITGGSLANERLGGSIATALLAVQRGAKIVRVHDVKETVQALTAMSAIDPL